LAFIGLKEKHFVMATSQFSPSMLIERKPLVLPSRPIKVSHYC